MFNQFKVVIGKDFKTEEHIRLTVKNDKSDDKPYTNENEVGVGGVGHKYIAPLTQESLKKWNALGITDQEILDAEESDVETEDDKSSVHEDAGM